MKITQVKDIKEVWPHFYEFCVKSKPYDFCSIASKSLRDKKILNYFQEFTSYHTYKAEEGDCLIGFAFIKEEEACLDVAFIFGIWRNTRSSKMIEATHAIFEFALKKTNKNYLKSEIRRNFKVDTYKKWIEKYDKTAIIFNDEDNTVVWCKRNIMTVKFKVVGANKTTKHLMGKDVFLRETKRVKHGLLREMAIDEEIYLFDEKGVDFLSEAVLVNGLLSDNKENVGRVTLQFLPQK